MGVTARSDAEKSQVIISVDGRFDFSQHKAFREAYKDASGKSTKFVVDLSDASYLDSSALGMLLLLREFVGADPKRVRITGANEDVARVLKIANFDKLFTVG
ncbi:STAS domain-containing protein [Thiorhodococcus minor]|uniref:Anti-sigma factor antagonist n=1 Tax=Thiorhodococcus minor TaxID=57489 RepID=A0A6M0JXH9_9GAMM|nr:STAS domain-containing protein [Thiorhodococcus minor]NEV61333.1 STAS domain-containing protein [Thiorhodococcus minor]